MLLLISTLLIIHHPLSSGIPHTHLILTFQHFALKWKLHPSAVGLASWPLASLAPRMGIKSGLNH